MKYIIAIFLSLIITQNANSQTMSMIDLLNIPSVRDGQLSPDAKSILFVKSTADWKKNKSVNTVWCASTAGDNLRQLTSNIGDFTAPRWSPDGSNILFLSKRGNDKNNQIYLFGAENRIYVHHKLKELNVQEFWKGKFPKNLEPTYEDKSILKDAKYMVDMSIIKGDGGGTQYTFLEAIYQDCVLVLHEEWINKGSLFVSGVNCIVVKNEEELAKVMNIGIPEELYDIILQNSKKIIEDHLVVDWL